MSTVTHESPQDRPRFSVFIATSLDGFIARSDGGIDWLAMVETPSQDYGYPQFFASIDTLLVGRGTYDTALGFPEWPYRHKRCLVLTHRPITPRYDETAIAGEPCAIARELYEAGARHVYVDGGATIRQFLAAGLVDSLTLSVVPILLGSGLRLFGPEQPETRLQLKQVRDFPTGLVQLRY